VVPLLAISAALCTSYVLSYYYIKDMIIEQMSLDAKSTAVAIEYIIEDDIESYNEFVEERIAGMPYYNKMMDRFTRLKEENNTIKYIYTIRKIEEGRTEFVLDADYAEQYPAGAKIQFAEDFGNEVSLKTMETGIANIMPPTDSINFGILIGGSAPIFHNGEVVGAVGVDIDIQTVYSILNNYLIISIIIGLVIVLFCTLVLVKSSDTLLQDVVKDKLTKAYQKKYTNKIINSGIESAQRLKQNFSILMLDLDHFKSVNDTYGHIFGDVVLSTTATVIANNIRKEDQFIRCGGEEFIVAAPNTDLKQAIELAERIRVNVENHEIYNRENDKRLHVTISIGVAAIKERDIDLFKLLELADKALYKAKETRNAVAVLS
jgi:diguanylate cyclase (GGDEF)-like protein